MDKKAPPIPTRESHRAPEQAAESLPDRRRFELGEKDWAEVQTALSAPPRYLPRLARLLNTPSAFER